MNATEQSALCSNEANAVREHLTSGHADFRNVLAERLASLNSG